jgi:TPR repeat protein
MGVDRDLNKAIELLDKSCQLECSQAYLIRALIGKLQDPESKLFTEYTSKAMELGNSNAYLLMSLEIFNPSHKPVATMYSSKKLLIRKLEESGTVGEYISVLERAVQLDNTVAMCNLGEYYCLKENYSEMVKLCTRCNEGGELQGISWNSR